MTVLVCRIDARRHSGDMDNNEAVIVTFRVEQHLHHTGQLKVDPVEFERVTGHPFDIDSVTEDQLRHYEHWNQFEDTITETGGDTDTESWSHFALNGAAS